MNTYSFHQPLLHTTTVTTSSSTTAATNVPGIIFRLILLSLLATVSLWANYEASKGFSITILNDAGKHSLAGKRFAIFYESNDKATRIVLNTSSFVEHLLYPNQNMHNTKKQINSVTLKFAHKSFPDVVSVYSHTPHEYVIMLSPSLMETSNNNNDHAVILAVLQGMARIWLWDGNGAAPVTVINGVVDYITTLAGFTKPPENSDHIQGCWKDEDPRKVAGLLRYYDQRKLQVGGGYGGGGAVIRRLNDGMRDGWDDGKMDDALGVTSQHGCVSYDILTRHHHLSSSI